MKSIVTHHSLGEITISQTWRARRISLSVRPTGQIRLSLPYHVPLSEGIKFVESKEDWIRKAITKYESRQPKEAISMPYSTHTHSLLLNPCDTDKIKTRVADRLIKVDYPLSMNYADAQVQDAIKKGIEQAWRIEAKAYLPRRLETIAERLGLKFHSVAIRNTVSKWGSCSSRDDISLSLHLMRLPGHLIDYILIHELCHIVHKDHSPRFHALLDKHTQGQHKALRKELKDYHTRW